MSPTFQPAATDDGVVIRVAVIEDDEEQRRFILDQVEAHPGLELVGSFGTGEEAVTELLSLNPNVVLVDIGLPGISGIQVVDELKPLMDGVQFMMLTVIEDAPLVFGALEAGATGYLLKRDVSERLFEAVRDLHWGGSPMSSAIARQVVGRFQSGTRTAPTDGEAALSQREREILGMLADGHLYKEVADRLGIGLGTVQTHVRRIYKKLHVHSRLEAIRNVWGSAGAGPGSPRPGSRLGR